MKRQSKLIIKFVAIVICVVLMSCSLQQISHPKTNITNNPSNTNNSQDSESKTEDAPCLRADTPKPKIIVSLGVINNKAIDIPKPIYPEAAKAERIFGEVKAGVIVDEKGNVAWARVYGGHPLLQAAVKKVVCQARFTPAKLSGRPIAVSGIITYKFVLD